MAKAVLPMDMPESCDMCDFVDNNQPPIYGVDKMYCGVPGVGEDVSDCIACRPDWCPLVELPEKMDGLMAADVFQECKHPVDCAQGWNALRDKIVGD